MPDGSVPVPNGIRSDPGRHCRFILQARPRGTPAATRFRCADDIVCHMAPLYKLRRGGTVSAALHGQMDWPWKS
jgi:hypothetical protein